MRVYDGSVLPKLRVKAGLSPEQLAIAIGRNVDSIQDYQSNRRPPPADVLGKLADALGVEVTVFFRGAGPG